MDFCNGENARRMFAEKRKGSRVPVTRRPRATLPETGGEAFSGADGAAPSLCSAQGLFRVWTHLCRGVNNVDVSPVIHGGTNGLTG